MKRPAKAEVQRLLGQHDGSISGLSRALGVARGVVQRWCTDYNLRGKGRGGQTSTAPPAEEVRAAYVRCGGSITRMAEEMGVPRSTVRAWAQNLGLEAQGSNKFDPIYPVEIRRSLRNGRVVCFSDCHWWSTDKSRAHEALLISLKKLKPDIVVAAGDVIDGARISRHDPIGWDDLPKLDDEIFAAQQHMAEIRRLSAGADHIWTLGNHCVRMEKYVVSNAGELEGLEGTRLSHHFPGWDVCWSLRIDDHTMIKHRIRGGQHGPWTSLLRAGINVIFGHSHSQKSYPFTDYRGTRYGVDLGMLAARTAPAFLYTEANPLDWREGYGIFDFRNGMMLPPSLVTVLDDGSVCWQKNEIVLQ